MLVIGPTPMVTTAVRLPNATPVFDDAVLDSEPRSEMSFLIADALRKRRIHARQGRSRASRRQ